MAKKTSERSRIANQPDKRPWAALISCVLTDDQLGFEGESCLLLHDDHIVELSASPIDGTDPGRGQRIRVKVFGFSSACDAETAGLKISGALLWLAVSIRCPLRLEYNTPQPSIVFDRRVPNRILSHGVTVRITRGASRATNAMRNVYELDTPFHPKLLTSLELFAAARLELTERTRFLGLVSAFEPIAEQTIYGEPIEALTKELLQVVSQRDDIPPEILPSIEGQIRNLKRESVRRAIRRLIDTHLNAGDEIDIVDVAYNARSSLIHDGRSDEDLSELSNRIEEILRRLYSAITGLSLDL